MTGGTNPDFTTTVLARLQAGYAGVADPAAAPAMARYMKDRFTFLGIPKPVRAPIDRAAVDGLAPPDEADLRTTALALWDRPEREYQYAACALLRRYVRVLTPAFLPTAAHLVTRRSWWDTVDDVAQNVVGPIVRLDRDPLGALMDEWIDDEDIWLARTALLHQNRYKQATDADRLFRYCERRAADKEFFIRKAIGWALREYSKTDGLAVRRFVADHESELSGLSRREALKWLDRRGGVPR